MATVRFSQKLREQIIHNAGTKLRPGVTRATEQKPDNAWGQRIYDTLFGDLQPALAQLPPGWTSETDKIEIEAVGDQQCALEFKLGKTQPWPVKFPKTKLAAKKYDFRSELILYNHSAWAEFYAEVKAYRARIDAAVAKQNEFIESVKKIINAYETLAPALKAWPPLWELVPTETKDRHREIVERTARGKGEAPALEGVDLDKLTAMATAAKIGA
jgi:hypothetical protein